MMRALFRKQMMELTSALFRSRRRGKRLSRWGIAGMLLLFALVYFSMAGLFSLTAAALCAPLTAAGLDWLYFAIMGSMALVLGAFCGALTTFAGLYEARDNELLLSLPVRPGQILAVRVLGVWLAVALYTGVVYFPAMAVYGATAGWEKLPAAAGLWLLLTLLALSLSCALGWAVAKLSARVRRKSAVTLLAVLAFLGVYYYCYFQANSVLQAFLKDLDRMGAAAKEIYPLYVLGRAGEGDLLSLALTALAALGLFALVYGILSASFLRIVTAQKAAAKRVYRERRARERSVRGALLFKERERFLSSPIYLVNCGLASVLLLAGAVAALALGGVARAWLESIDLPAEVIPLLLCAAICLTGGMGLISAPSVSLEGKSLWLIRSLPVSEREILRGKLELHLLFAGVPALLCGLCAGVGLGVPLHLTALIALVSALFVLLLGETGLLLNLKMPNFEWTNETVPVKQGASMGVSLFLGWGLTALLGVGCFLLWESLGAAVCLLVCALVLGALALGGLALLRGWGEEAFSNL